MQRLLCILWWVVLCAGLLPAMLASPTAAQTTGAEPAATLPSPLTRDAAEALVARLSDAQVRQLLLTQLDAAATPAAPATQDVLTDLADAVPGFLATAIVGLVTVIRATPDILADEGQLLAGYAARLGWAGAGQVVAVILAAAFAGWLAERGWHRLIIVRRGPVAHVTEAQSFPEVVRIVCRRLLRHCIGAFVQFMAMVTLIHLFLAPPESVTARSVAMWLIFFPRIGSALLASGLEPRRPDLRMVALTDSMARYLYRNFLGILVTIGLCVTLLHLNHQLGAPVVLDRLGFWLNLIIFIWLAIVVVQARDGLATIIQGRTDTVTPLEIAVSHAYPWFALAAIALTWVLSNVMAAYGAGDKLQRGLHLLTLALVLITPLMDALIRATVLHLASPMRGTGDVATRAYTATLRSYKRMGRVLVFGAVVGLLTRLWDINLANLASQGLGEQFAAHAIRATLICVSGYLVWEVVRLLINRKLAHERTEARSHAGGDDPEGLSTLPVASRLGTVLPPVSWALQGVVITLTVLTALGNLGIDVTPLLAGAGIAGIAIGFGAQKLVSDIVSGLFFLIDDAFRLNEYIDASGTMGSVEKISLRSLRLRDDNGPLYCIPYSEISKVTNFGRDWGIMKLKFTVPFDTDPEKIRRIFKKIGQEMLANPELADGFLEPFKSQGVNDFNETGMVVRGKFKFKPGTQFPIRKEIYRRVQQEFAAAGIEFARKEVRVTVSEPGNHLTRDQTLAIGAAAAQIIGPVPDAT